MSIIYASPLIAHRNTLWDNLRQTKDNYLSPWLGGDFNEITCQADKCGGNPINRARANRFINCTNYCGVIDLGFKGSHYTWSNHRKT